MLKFILQSTSEPGFGKTAKGDTGMIAGPEQVATEEHSLSRMSDGEHNDDPYESDAPSEESERDEDSPQRSH
jgi:hypothetical protein